MRPSTSAASLAILALIAAGSLSACSSQEPLTSSSSESSFPDSGGGQIVYSDGGQISDQQMPDQEVLDQAQAAQEEDSLSAESPDEALGEEADYSADAIQVCQDSSGLRVPDEQCEPQYQSSQNQGAQNQQSSGSALGPVFWYYIAVQNSAAQTSSGEIMKAPAVGAKLSGGSRTLPADQTLSRVPAAGAKFTTPDVSDGTTRFVPYGTAADKYASANTAPSTLKQDSAWLRSYGSTANTYSSGSSARSGTQGSSKGSGAVSGRSSSGGTSGGAASGGSRGGRR